MLERVLKHIHNRFEYGNALKGNYTIVDGALPLPMLDGQYYWIDGSVFNDGLHQYPNDDLHDESFYGCIQGLAIPQEIISLAGEIADWVDNNSKTLDSPLQSESFGGYSYTKSSGNSSGNSDLDGWQEHFRVRLNPWRKLSDW